MVYSLFQTKRHFFAERFCDGSSQPRLLTLFCGTFEIPVDLLRYLPVSCKNPYTFNNQVSSKLEIDDRFVLVLIKV